MDPTRDPNSTKRPHNESSSPDEAPDQKSGRFGPTSPPTTSQPASDSEITGVSQFTLRDASEISQETEVLFESSAPPAQQAEHHRGRPVTGSRPPADSLLSSLSGLALAPPPFPAPAQPANGVSTTAGAPFRPAGIFAANFSLGGTSPFNPRSGLHPGSVSPTRDPVRQGRGMFANTSRGCVSGGGYSGRDSLREPPNTHTSGGLFGASTGCASGFEAGGVSLGGEPLGGIMRGHFVMQGRDRGVGGKVVVDSKYGAYCANAPSCRLGSSATGRGGLSDSSTSTPEADRGRGGLSDSVGQNEYCHSSPLAGSHAVGSYFGNVGGPANFGVDDDDDDVPDIPLLPRSFGTFTSDGRPRQIPARASRFPASTLSPTTPASRGPARDLGVTTPPSRTSNHWTDAPGAPSSRSTGVGRVSNYRRPMGVPKSPTRRSGRRRECGAGSDMVFGASGDEDDMGIDDSPTGPPPAFGGRRGGDDDEKMGGL